MPVSPHTPDQDKPKQAKASCSADNQFIVNLKSLKNDKTKVMVHPCGCSTVKDMQGIETDPSKIGFASLEAVERYAASLGAKPITPKACKLPGRPAETGTDLRAPQRNDNTTTAQTYSKESALKLLQDSQGHRGHHPGDHVPLNGEAPSVMAQKAAARTAPITSFYLSRDDATADVAKIMNDNRERIAAMRPNGFLPLEKQSLETERKIGVYHKQGGTSETTQTKVGTLILKNDDKGLHIITFYPEAPRRR